MPARTNVRLSVGKGIYKSCITLLSQLGTFLWKFDCGLYHQISSSLILSYSKMIHVHYGRHNSDVTDCSWLSSASLNICTLVNDYDA